MNNSRVVLDGISPMILSKTYTKYFVDNTLHYASRHNDLYHILKLAITWTEVQVLVVNLRILDGGHAT